MFVVFVVAPFTDRDLSLTVFTFTFFAANGTALLAVLVVLVVVFEVFAVVVTGAAVELVSCWNFRKKIRKTERIDCWDEGEFEKWSYFIMRNPESNFKNW